MIEFNEPIIILIIISQPSCKKAYTMHKFFKKHNLRATKQRVLILQTLKKQNKPVSYNEIKDALSPYMDKATFYRNIEKLESVGAVTKLELDNRWYFEIFKHKHSHFICKSCHQIECIEQIPMLQNYEVETALFKGICKKCS